MLTRDDLGSILEPRTYGPVRPASIYWLPLAILLYAW